MDQSVSDGVLNLEGVEPVAHGKQRDIYFFKASDPRNPVPGKAVVLKVTRAKTGDQFWYRTKMLLSNMLGLSGLRGRVTEARYSQKLAERWSLEGTPPVPEFLGTLRTSRGRGALWQAAIDSNGALAPTLNQLARDGRHTEFLRPLNDFTNILFRSDIVATDINLANLVLVSKDGQPRILLIDGFGDHRMISLRAFDRKRNHTGLHRRLEKIAAKAGLAYDREQRRFDVPESAAVTRNRLVSPHASDP